MSKKSKRRHKKKWWEVHHERCMDFRTQTDTKQGDGFRRLALMKEGSDIERALAETMEKVAREAFMSADFFDALVAAYGKAHYGNNPPRYLRLVRSRRD